MLLLVLLGLSGLILLPGLLSGPSLDASVFVSVTGRMLDGATLYVDAWDHKPPGIFLIEAGSRLAFGWLGAWPSAWLVTVASTALTGWLVAVVAGRIGVGRLAQWVAGAGVVLASAQPLISAGGGMTEPPATALAVVALTLATGRIRAVTLLAIGALLAASVLTSFLLLPAVVAVGGLVLARGGRLGAVAGLALGAGLALAAVVGWLALTGALPAAWDALVVYNAAYRDANAVLGFALSRAVIGWTLLLTLFVIPPAALGVMAGLREGGLRGALAAACVAWIVVELVLVMLQGRVFAHYAVAVLAPAAVLAALGLNRLAQRWRASAGPNRRVRRGMLAAPLIAAALASLAGMAAKGTAGTELGVAPVRLARIDAVREAVEQLAGADAAVLVWGNEPRLYLALDRPIAVRYPYFFPLTTPGYTSAALVDETLDQLRASPPRVIVDAGSPSPGAPGFLPLLIDRPLAATGRDADLLDPIRAFVATRYHLVEVVDGWPVYVLNDA